MAKVKQSTEFETNDYTALNRGVEEVAARSSLATRLLRAKLLRENAKVFIIWAAVAGILCILLGIAIFIGRGQLDIKMGGNAEKIQYIKVPDPDKSQIIEKTIVIEKPIIRRIEDPEETGVITSYTIFKTVDNPLNLKLSVVTGLNFTNSKAKAPNHQYCYASTLDEILDVTNRIDLANKDSYGGLEIEKISNSQATQMNIELAQANKLSEYCKFETHEAGSDPQRKDGSEKAPALPSGTVSTGTGFAINADGIIVTNEHVVEGCNIFGFAYEGKSYPLRLISKNKKLDIALLKSGKIKIQDYLKFSSSLKTAQEIFAFGYPLQGELSKEIKVTQGIVSSLAGMKNDKSRIQITAALQPGNSGGPVVDNRGDVVGASVAALRGDLLQDINFAIKKDYILEYLSQKNIDFEVSAPSDPKENTEVVELVEKSVFPIICR